MMAVTDGIKRIKAKLKSPKIGITRFISIINISNFVKSPLAVHYPKKKIRKRLSYQFWSNVTNSISMLPNKQRIRVIYNMWLQMDGRHAFGTFKQAGFELESAVLSLMDLKEKQNGTK